MEKYEMYSHLLKSTLIEIRYYARRNTDLAKEITKYFIDEAQTFRKLRDKSMQESSIILKAAHNRDGN